MKGWTLGPGIEGRNVTHQIEEADRGRAEDRSATGSSSASRTSSSKDAALLPPRRRLAPRSSTCSSGAGALGGSLPGGVVRAEAAARARATASFAEFLGGHRRQAGVHHDGLHPPAAQADARPGDRQADRADHPRRGAHVRHGRAVQEVEDLRPARASVRAGRRELLLSYREATDGQILEEGITEAGAMASFTAAGTAYATLGRADDPVLHLLLDVRLPARSAT